MVGQPPPDAGEPEIVVVAYGAPGLLRRALEPVAGAFPVTVVDNSSLPEIRALCTRLGCAYHDPGSNGGFAAGVNHALDRRQAPGRDVLLLNPDAVITASAVASLERSLGERPRAASLTCSQRDESGGRAQVSWPFPTPARYAADAVRSAHRLPEPARYVVGSVLLLRSSALDDVGRFDERFFLYFEETDWQYRAHLAGWTNEVVEEVSAFHVGGATSTDSRRRDAHFEASLEKYVRKHFGTAGWQVSRASIVAQSIGRVVRHPRSCAAPARRAGAYLRGPARVERRWLSSGRREPHDPSG